MRLNSDEIERILPHRYPFLLVDRIDDGEIGKWAKGIKCVTANEPFFQGHFPGNKVMPGVLIIEALAQVGAVAVLAEEGAVGKTVYFGGIKQARFRRKVVPGDVLELYCELTARRGALGIGKAVATVRGEKAAEAELSFAIAE